MPKNKGKGGKKHKRGKDGGLVTDAPLELKDEGQAYGLVVRMLGGCRAEVACHDGKTRMGTIRGNMRKRVYINTGDCVLVGLRDYQDTRCDIIHKYTAHEFRELKKLNHISADLEEKLDSRRSEPYKHRQDAENGSESAANQQDRDLIHDLPFDFQEL
jgi:translation initiation factor 1A